MDGSKALPKVSYGKKGNIAYVRLNRPEKFNAIDREMNRLLHDIWVDIKQDDDVYVAIVSGEGSQFCAGFDLEVFREEVSEEDYEWRKSAMFGSLKSTPNEHEVYKPVITAVQGHVNGMGTWLMLQGDIRIAAEDTSVGLGEARLNFPVEFSGLLTRLLPLNIAAELLYTARPISAGRLHEIGVINKVVRSGELMDAAESVAADICRCGQASIRAMKELVCKGQYLSYAAVLSLTRDLAVPIVNSDETSAAIDRFLDRRKDGGKKRPGRF